MNCSSIISLLVLAGIANPAYCNAAQEDPKGVLSGSVTLASEYSFRGLTQDDEKPALQAGMIYTHPITEKTSFYGSLWGSNVDFKDGNEATVEIDGAGGVIYKHRRWSFDTGLIYYAYPGASGSLEYDYAEIQQKISYDFPKATLSGSVHYSPDYFAGSGQSYYEEANLLIPLPKNFSFNGHLGLLQVQDNAAFALPDYTDWGMGITYSHNGFDFAVSYVDTSISNTTCQRGCEGRTLFSITKNF